MIEPLYHFPGLGCPLWFLPLFPQVQGNLSDWLFLICLTSGCFPVPEKPLGPHSHHLKHCRAREAERGSEDEERTPTPALSECLVILGPSLSFSLQALLGMYYYSVHVDFSLFLHTYLSAPKDRNHACQCPQLPAQCLAHIRH